jgi:hypothetical protein
MAEIYGSGSNIILPVMPELEVQGIEREQLKFILTHPYKRSKRSFGERLYLSSAAVVDVKYSLTIKIKFYTSIRDTLATADHFGGRRGPRKVKVRIRLLFKQRRLGVPT